MAPSEQDLDHSFLRHGVVVPGHGGARADVRTAGRWQRGRGARAHAGPRADPARARTRHVRARRGRARAARDPRRDRARRVFAGRAGNASRRRPIRRSAERFPRSSWRRRAGELRSRVAALPRRSGQASLPPRAAAGRRGRAPGRAIRAGARARRSDPDACARGARPLTEEHNYWIDRVSQAHARRLALAAGARLVRDGTLDVADEIFLLYVPEIADALRAPGSLRALVAQRRRELARWQRLSAPPTVGAAATAPPTITPGVALERVDFDYAVKQDGTNTLKGVTASPGVARGPARLIADEGEFSKMRQGDVLVCRQSTASWVPLYTMAAAVITELGGSLCHAAVVAREFGVPAVVAVGGALSTLSDGEPLEVDASAGTVRRLFPVIWSDPEDAKLVWRRDDAHVTHVITPLAIEYTRRGANYGMRRRDEELGSPVLMRLESFNGRNYSGSQALRPPDDIAAHQKVALVKRRSLARRLRRDWDERYLPELNAHYGWMRSLFLEGLSGDEAASA